MNEMLAILAAALSCNDYGSASVRRVYRSVDINTRHCLDLSERLSFANPTGNLFKLIWGKLGLISDRLTVGAHGSQLRLLGTQFNPLG